MSLRLDWCSHEAAKYAVEHWHYSRCMVPSKTAKVGVWEAGQFIGALVFGVGATPEIGRPYGLEQTAVCELVRVALRAHHAPVSRIVAIAIRLLKQQFPGLRLIVSYADPMQQHLGGIYQAGNWLYVGQTAGDREILVDGKWTHRRVLTHKGTSSVKGRIYRDTPGKHKYLYPLDAAMRAQVAPLAKPYPKRAGSVVGDTATAQVAEDGSTPIPALQVQTEA